MDANYVMIELAIREYVNAKDARDVCMKRMRQAKADLYNALARLDKTFYTAELAHCNALIRRNGDSVVIELYGSEK